MAFGFVMFGSSLGVAVIPMVASKLLEIMDWRTAYICFAGLSLVMGFAGHQLVFRVLGFRKPVPRVDQTLDDSTNLRQSTDGLTFAESLKDYRFWVLALILVITSAFVIGFGIHLPSHATDQGISLVDAAQAAGLWGVASASARVGVALILDKVFAPLLACAAFLLAAAGFYCLSCDMAQFPWLLPLSAVLIGTAAGSEGDFAPFMIRKYFGIKAFGITYGALYSAILLASAASTYLYGWTFDQMKSYGPILQLAAISCCLCGVGVLTLGRYRFGASHASS
jgi:MFS family permease